MLVRHVPTDLLNFGYIRVFDAEFNVQVRLVKNSKDPGYLLDLLEDINKIAQANAGYVEINGDISLETRKFDTNNDPNKTAVEHFVGFGVVASNPDPDKVAMILRGQDETRRFAARAAAERRAMTGPKLVSTTQFRGAATAAREASEAVTSVSNSNELPV